MAETTIDGTTGGFTVEVIGRVAVRSGDGRLTESMRPVICALVAAGNRGVSAHDLLAGEATATALAGARMSMTRVRRAIDGEPVESVDRRYRLVLPVHEVDLWLVQHLAGGGALGDVSDAALRHLVRATPIFPEIDLDEHLDDVRFAAEAARRRLVVRVAAERPHLLDATLRDDLLAHVADAPDDEPLVRAALMSLMAAGDRRGSLDLLSRTSRAMYAAGLGLPSDLAALEQRLLDGDPLPGDTTPAALTVPTDRPARLSPRMRAARSAPFVGARLGLQAVVDRFVAADGPTAVLLTGLAGAGKSRVAAEVAHAMAEHGWVVVDALAPPPPATMAFGPFVDAVPGLAAEVRSAFASDTDPESRRATVWGAAIDALDHLAQQQPVLLVVDDAQWLDAPSLEFVVQLLTSTRAPRGLLIAGRSDTDSAAAWSQITTAATRAGALTIEPPTLDEIEMDTFIAQRNPSLTLRERGDMVGELTRRSKGLPGVAAVLLAGYDARTKRLPSTRDLGRDQAAALLSDSGLSDHARTVGAVAALAGADIDVTELVTVTGLSVDEVLGGLDELLRRDLLVERSPVRVATSHALADAALLADVPRQMAARWHAASAQLHTDDVHRLARHLTGAVPHVPVDDAVQAQIRSASALLAAGLAREAAAAYDTAAALAGGSLDAEVVVSWSRAHDVSGAHEMADALRSPAIDAAVAAGDHGLALRLAISGLPEAEGVDGTPHTADNLRRVDADRLTRRERWQHALAFGRQLAATGQVVEALAMAETARRMARTGEEMLAAAVCLRAARAATTDPRDRLVGLDEVDALVGECPVALQAEYLLVRAIDLYEARRRPEALACYQRLLALDGLPPLRRWHALLFQAMVLTDDGDQAAAEAARLDALHVAMASGFREGESAFLMSQFVDVWRAGVAGAFLPLVENGQIDPGRAAAARAAVAAVLDGAGRSDDALAAAEQVAASVVEAPTFQGIPALVLAAPILARSTDRELVSRARRLLTARGDSLIVLGAGCACLGDAPTLAAPLVTADDDTTTT